MNAITRAFRTYPIAWFIAGIWHAMLNTVGGQFFFQMAQGADQARLGVLMSVAYLLVAAAVYQADRTRLPREQAALSG